MKAISRAIDRFCFKHKRFGIPMLMRYIVIISAVVYVLTLMDNSVVVMDINRQGIGALRSNTVMHFILFNPDLILRGQVWRIFTWVFFPIQGSPIFTLIALYFYYFIGTTLEREWGTPKFTIFYLSGVLLNVIYGFIMFYVFNSFFFLSALSLNLSLFFAFAVLFPDHVVRLFFIIPIKVKWLAVVNAAFFLFSIFSQLMVGNIGMAFLPLVSLLNFILICGNDLIHRIKPLVKAHGKSEFSKFKRETNKARHESSRMQYRHKCAVCGKTDTEYPDLEFRYCSRCEGYHCFCIDHINNHVHFK